MTIEVHHDKRSKLFIPAFVIGWAIIVAGAMVALHDARDAHPFALAVHVVAFDLGHDVLLVPTSLLIAWLVGRVVPAIARGPVRAGLAVSAMFIIFAYPLIKRWGRRPTNSSTLPLNYARNLTIVLVLVWIVVGASIAWRLKRRGNRRSVIVGAVELVEGSLQDVEEVGGDGRILLPLDPAVDLSGDLDRAAHLGEILEAVRTNGEVPIDGLDEPARENALEVVGDQLGPLLADDDAATETSHDATPN